METPAEHPSTVLVASACLGLTRGWAAASTQPNTTGRVKDRRNKRAAATKSSHCLDLNIGESEIVGRSLTGRPFSVAVRNTVLNAGEAPGVSHSGKCTAGCTNLEGSPTAKGIPKAAASSSLRALPRVCCERASSLAWLNRKQSTEPDRQWQRAVKPRQDLFRVQDH